MPEQALPPLLSTHHLNAFYGDFQALFGVSLEIYPGEIIAIIGANGAGKTTFMRSITGLLDSTPESISLHGKPVGHLRADQIAHLGIAMVPEGRQLFPSLTTEENLLIGGQMKRPGPWNLERVYELFPILKERRLQNCMSLSGGQQQMVAIGRALMANPELILFDEISLGLAPIVINDIYAALPKIIGENMSVIIVEQDTSRAMAVSDRSYCFQEGRVSLEGCSDTLTREMINKAYFGV